MAYKELTVHTVNFHYNSRMLSFSEYVSSHNSIVSESNTALKINNLIECIWHLSKDQNSIVFTAGNGGSASTAEHFSADLGQMEKRTGNAVRSLSLNSQIALNSAFTNDLNHESAMVKQLSSFKNFNYILITFSASGNSENIVNAIESSLALNKKVFCFVGFDGGKVINIKNAQLIYFPDKSKDYGKVENLHLAASHYVVDRLVEKFKAN
jgi:D-sedoheptulose 7-phosphate isomerase